MPKLKLKDVKQYVEKNIGTFHHKRIDSIGKLKLSNVLKRKNPYLFKAKNIMTAAQFVEVVVNAHTSSSEEAIFGDWLEGLAIFINSKVYGGIKSGITGIDLEFTKDSIRYIVTIKSGPNWGNSSQIKKMISDFATATKALRTSNSRLNVIAVNGCCSGSDKKPDKGSYFKYCGQVFWEFISANPDLYIEIIEPLGYLAKEKNDEYLTAYNKMLNLFTKEFLETFCLPSGDIDWEKIIKLNSGIKIK